MIHSTKKPPVKCSNDTFRRGSSVLSIISSLLNVALSVVENRDDKQANGNERIWGVGPLPFNMPMVMYR